ncbi:MAG: hypothetical protein P1U89_01600 [Verrucomicrobiales bacterium]|nr:hypothetical protein [Verrucomicrobiales bacterium]
MKNRTIIGILSLAAVMVVATSCNSTNQAGNAVVDPSAASGDTPPNTTGFLQTSYEPLSNWMDERFEVKYRAMTPELIFDQVPLNDIHYQTSNLPASAPSFNYESANVSRRELLKKIADHWNLKMSYVNGDDGNPSAVAVSG